MFIGRGDLDHAGGSGNDLPIDSSGGCFRLHYYAGREGLWFPGSINALGSD